MNYFFLELILSVPLGTLPFSFSLSVHLPHEGTDRVQGGHVESCRALSSLPFPCVLMEILPETKDH